MPAGSPTVTAIRGRPCSAISALVYVAELWAVPPLLLALLGGAVVVFAAAEESRPEAALLLLGGLLHFVGLAGTRLLDAAIVFDAARVGTHVGRGNRRRRAPGIRSPCRHARVERAVVERTVVV